MVLRKQDGISAESNSTVCEANEMCFYNRNNTNGQGQEFVAGSLKEAKKRTVETLQSAFLQFKRNRQNKLKQQALMETRMKANQRDDDEMMKLRQKFVEQAKLYLGVPYARRYHEPGSAEYDAPLFLDCCGLVRKVLRDLKEDFGFTIGPWNQSYMFDTLPIDVQDASEMKPGDLVFVSGVFYKPKMRKQRHNMVHVEIWAGEGEKTIGARWQRGKLQVHDSYQYVSKSYHSMVYHFKSIDTWLKGICKSFCSEHSWKSSTYMPGKRSIFAIEEPSSDEAAEGWSEDEQLLELEDHSNKNGAAVREEFHERNYLKPKPESKNKKTRNSFLNEPEFEINGNISERSEDMDREETSDGRESLWINTCFCDHCVCGGGDFVFQNNAVPNLGSEILLHSTDPNFGTKTDNFGGGQRWDPDSAETWVKKCCLLNGDVVLNGSPNDVLVCSVSHPNGAGTGAETRTRQGTVSRNVTGRGKGSTRKKSPNDDDDHSNERRPTRPLCRPNPSYTRLHQRSPTFFIGGHNGAKMVEATLTSLGWTRIHDNNDRTFYLKWVECKKNVDFSSFREGEQLVNHIPNGNLLTTKIGLLTSLQEFERVSSKVQSSPSKNISMKDFVPETYKLQNQTERDNFMQQIYQEDEMWICKPTGMNQGKGIFLIRNRNELEERLGPKNQSHGRQKCFPPPGRVVQRYISNPFLLNGFKADIRTYMLIAGTCPYMVFYHAGYVRLSLVPYSLNQEEMHAHLTNQYIQKKHPLYEQVKEETVWSLEKLQEYINHTCNNGNTLPQDWVFTEFTKRMQEIMLRCFNSVRHKLERKLGYFDLLGFDFMLDENLKVWLIEINVNPALHTNCKILSDVIPELVDGTLRLVLEVFEKSKRKEKLAPLENLGKFQLLYSGERK